MKTVYELQEDEMTVKFKIVHGSVINAEVDCLVLTAPNNFNLECGDSLCKQVYKKIENN